MKSGLTILYEDEYLLAVDKPAGLLSVPDRHDPDLPHLRNVLPDRYGRLYTVHRLDRDTSGLLVLARDPETHTLLSGLFESRRIQKTYRALVEGHPRPEKGLIERPIAPHPSRPGRMILSAKGKEARSSYQVLEPFRTASLMEVVIHTGRTHQIRLHLQSIGHPLLVDPFYGHREAFFLSQLKGNRYRPNRSGTERPLLARLSLHAYRLQFDHPRSGRELILEATLPKDLRATLKQLRKWDGS